MERERQIEVHPVERQIAGVPEKITTFTAMNNKVFITRVAKYLPNNPVDND